MLGYLKPLMLLPAALIISSQLVYAAEIPSGELLCNETFEGEGVFSNVKIIAEAGGNNAMYLSDELSDIVYTPSVNGSIEGDFKVLQKGENASFEIIPQSSPMGENYYGGDKYNLFAVELSRGFTVIDKTIGEDVKINDGWNTFKIVTIGQKAMFEVNGKITCADITSRTPSLRFRAENCEILIDNVSVSSLTNRGATMTALVAQKQQHTVSSYEPYNFIENSGLVALYSGNTRVNPVSVGLTEYKVEGDYRELSNGYGYFYSDSTVTFTYKGFTCTVEIKVDNKGLTKGECLSETVYKRRQELAYAAYYSLNNSGISKSSASYSRLFDLLSAPYLYPTSEQHDEVVDLFLTMAEETDFKTRGSVGAEDFIAIDLILLRGNEKLNISEELKKRIDDYFIRLDFSDPEEGLSENHRMTYYAIGIAAFERYPDAVFFNGLGAEENKELYKGYILDWIDFRMKYGMGEYDSANYYTIDFAALETIYTYTKDAELKRKVYEMLMYLYTDAALDSNNSVLGGAQSRLYVNSLNSCKLTALDIIFDNYITPDKSFTLQMLPLCYSEFVPQQSLIELKADQRESYINIEKRRMYTIPDDYELMGAVTKYSFVTPDYIIGSLVESDNLPENAYKKNNKYYVDTGTYAEATRVLPDFQAIGFNINLNGNSLLNIIDSHPGGEYSVLSGAHNYFAGDHGCHCARYGQHEHTVLGIRHIKDKSLPQFSHFYVNKNEFDEVIEEKGWIILRSGTAYAAIKPIDLNNPDMETAYEWGSEEELFAKTPLSQLEVKINSADTAFIAEAYSESEIGDFLNFVERILATVMSVTDNTLTYTNIAGEKLVLDYESEVFSVDGNEQKYADKYTDSGNQYISSEWGNSSVLYHTLETPQDNYVNVYKKGLNLYKVIPMRENGELFVAIYDNNGRMQSIEKKTDEEVAEYSGARVKALLWEDVNSIKPITAQSY